MKCEYPFYSEFLLAIKLFIFTHSICISYFQGIANANQKTTFEDKFMSPVSSVFHTEVTMSIGLKN